MIGWEVVGEVVRGGVWSYFWLGGVWVCELSWWVSGGCGVLGCECCE